MPSWAWVFVGGGAGSVCRYLVAQLPLGRMPYATLIANVAASLLLGALVAYTARQDLPSSYRLLFMTGFCGGFSTFSTFSTESFELLQQGQMTAFVLNVAANVGLCLLAVWCGAKAVGLMHSSSAF